MKCGRTACHCTRRLVWRHTQTGVFYCNRCALRINEFNPGLLVRRMMTEDEFTAWWSQFCVIWREKCGADLAPWADKETWRESFTDGDSPEDAFHAEMEAAAHDCEVMP